MTESTETSPGPPTDPVSGNGATGSRLHETAQWVGGHAWVELRTFELLGRWATTVDEPAAAALLGRASRHHGWHAQLWHEQLPSLRGLAPEDLVDAPDAGWADAVEALAVEPPATAVEALAVAYRVLVPRLVTRYDDHRAVVSPVMDAAVARTLRIVHADAVADWLAGEALVQRLLVDRAAVERATARAAGIEVSFAGVVPTGGSRVVPSPLHADHSG